MASELRVNTINSRSGLGTITVSDTGAVFTGITTIGSVTVDGGTVTGNLTGNVTGNATGLSGSPTLTGITSVSTTNLTVNGNAYPAAGPLSNRNLIINGAMQVAQRGTSVSVGSGTYTLDRWSTDKDGTVTATVSQQSFTLGQTDVPNEPQNYLRFDVTAASGGSYLNLRHFIENVRNGAGQTVTLSFWAKADASRTLNLRYQQYCGSGGSSITPVSLTAKNLTTSWQKFTETFTLASLSGKTVSGGNDSLRILFDLPVNTVETFDFANVQLEVGSVATPFEHRSYGDELDRCERYFQLVDSFVATGYGSGAGIGMALSFRKQMRASPSLSVTGVLYVSDLVASDYVQSSVTGSIVSNNRNERGCRMAAANFSGLTDYRTYQARPGLGGEIQLSAEL